MAGAMPRSARSERLARGGVPAGPRTAFYYTTQHSGHPHTLCRQPACHGNTAFRLRPGRRLRTTACPPARTTCPRTCATRTRPSPNPGCGTWPMPPKERRSSISMRASSGVPLNYYIFLGSNTTDDFNLRRNRHYRMEVTVRGVSNDDCRVSMTTLLLSEGFAPEYDCSQTATLKLLPFCTNDPDAALYLSYELVEGTGRAILDGSDFPQDERRVVSDTRSRWAIRSPIPGTCGYASR